MTYRELPIRRLPGRKPVTELADYEFFCGLSQSATPERTADQMTVKELKALRDAGKAPILIDVREPHEWDIVSIPDAVPLSKSPTVAQEIVERYGQEQPLVISCRSGARSQAVLEELRKIDRRNVRNLEGGVLAWVRDIDPSLPTY